MRLVQTVAPVQEPISLAEAKDTLKVLDNDSDARISDLIVTFREHVENITNRQLEIATYELYSENFISALPKNPINSILKIEYMDENEVYQVLDTNLYYLYEENGVGKIMYLDLLSAPFPTIKEHKEAVKITFTCGYAKVPEPIKRYMKVKISSHFNESDDFVIGASISKHDDDFIENLLIPYKIRSV